MSEDRFERIQRSWKDNYGAAVANGDIDWLISEVERLREALDGPIRNIAYDVKQGGILGEMLLEEIEKALATPHSAGRRVESPDKAWWKRQKERD